MKFMIIGGGVGYIVSLLLLATLGPAYGCAIIGMTFGAAYCAHNDRSKWLIGLFLKAIDAHMARKEAAIVMGIDPAQLSRWESGIEQASLNRLAQLPNEVLRDAVTPLLEGLGDVVAPSGRLASATSALLRYLAAEEAKTPLTRPQQRSA